MRSTIRQVASQAGVSCATVSNVLRGVENCASEETRNRVLDAARRLNYVPVRPPTSQNRPLETRIVTLVPEHNDFMQHELDWFTYAGIVEGARQHGYDVLTMSRSDSDWGSEGEKLRFLDRRSDGFIFAISMRGRWEAAIDLVAENAIPSVVCYRRQVPKRVAWVDIDNLGAQRQAVQHLAQNGHRRIAYLSGPTDNYDAVGRCNAWKTAMRECDLPVHDNYVVHGNNAYYVQQPKAIASVATLDVTAVVCFNDTLALALWDSLEAQGLRVPDAISLIGMDNRPEAAERGLSSIAHSFADVGRLAMKAWIKLKNGSDVADCCDVSTTHLVPRISVRKLHHSQDRLYVQPALLSGTRYAKT
jgi:LacI family transcriptional regulator